MTLCKITRRNLPECKIGHISFRTEVVIYLLERDANGNSRRFPASEVSKFLNQANVKVLPCFKSNG